MSCKLLNTFIAVMLLPWALLSQGFEDESHLDNSTAVEIQSIRVGRTLGNTRLVFDLSGPASYKVSIPENPGRLLITIFNSSSNIDPAQVDLRGSNIVRVQSAPRHGQSMTYTLEMTGKVVPTSFLLEPTDNRGYRIVMDLSSKAWAGSANDYASLAQAATSAADAKNLQQETDSSKNVKHTEVPIAPEVLTGEWSGYISIETFLFSEDPAYNKQEKYTLSSALKPEYYLDWADGRQRFAFSPFFRYDAKDDKRTHADIRELYWRMEKGDWVVKAGLDVVFWGVIEAQHLVDIINQTDLVENVDGEEKLGQPMVNLDYLSDWGIWQFYILPYFRERTFPGVRGRPRTQPAVDTNHAQYQSGSEENHVDLAVRWSYYIGDWDIGLAHFSGTSREPILVTSEPSRKPALIPYYIQIDQTSLDAQATKGAWLWKLEAIYNSNDIKDYYAYASGFEYTHVGVASTQADLGFLLEYHYDERSGEFTTTLQKDIYAGLRYTENDIAGTQLLAGVIYDIDSQSTFFTIEGSRRIYESWLLSMDIRVFSSIDKNDLISDFRDDSYLTMQVKRYF